MGPTPPGTGVIAPATSSASSNATVAHQTLGGAECTPTSITVAPGLIMSPRTISGLPTAA